MGDTDKEIGPIGKEGESERPLNILLVEDDNDMPPLIKMALNGHKVTVFDNTDQALEKLRENQRLGTPFDWIITDWGLVGQMDGFGLAKAVKDENLGSPFVTLFTANASKAQQENSPEQLKEKGIHQVMGKPFKRSDFTTAIQLAREFGRQFQVPPPQKI